MEQRLLFCSNRDIHGIGDIDCVGNNMKPIRLFNLLVLLTALLYYDPVTAICVWFGVVLAEKIIVGVFGI